MVATNWSSLIRLLGYLKPYWGRVLITWLISLLVLLLQGFSIWLGADFIEKLIMSESYQAYDDTVGYQSYLKDLFNWFSEKVLIQNTPFDSLIVAVSILAAAGIVTAVFRYVKLAILASMNQNILQRIREQLFNKISHLDLLFSSRYRSGEISSLFVHDVDQINFALIDLIDRIIMQPARLILGVYLMLLVSWQTTLITLACLLPISLLIHFSGSMMQKLSNRFMKQVASFQGKLTESISVMKLIKTFSQERAHQDKFSADAETLKQSKVRLMWMDAAAPQIVRAIVVLTASILTLVGGYQVLVSKTMDGGDLLKLALLLPMVTYPVESLAALYVSLRSSLASIRRVFTMMDMQEYQSKSGQLEPSFTGALSIQLDKIDLQVDNNRILSQVSFEIPAGQCLALVGPSGAGKSSILSILAKLSSPSGGEVSINEFSLADINDKYWRENIGIITQDTVLINASIKDNLLYAKSEASDKELLEVLYKVGLASGREDLQVLEKQVGNQGGHLSGGERQRLGIARVLLREPKLLLIDEPTASLDSQNRQQVRELLRGLVENTTSLIVTHDEELAMIADNRCTIENGQII